MAILFSPEEFGKLKEVNVLFGCALKDMATRVEILLEDFTNFQRNNPVEHTKQRLKSPESIAAKLHRLGLEITAENAREKLTDIAGMRIICAYARDIYYIADVLKQQPDLTVRIEKDYVTRPKPSGYRSYHLIMDIPVYLSHETHHMPVEVQIRTQAMDFWASLEHKVRYKYGEPRLIPKHLSDELVSCAEKIADLDEQMFEIHDMISMIRPGIVHAETDEEVVFV